MSRFLKIRLSALCLVMLSWAFVAAGQDIKCDICGDTIHENYHVMEDLTTYEKKKVCVACWKLENRCFICGLPVRENFETLRDGRIICERDAKAVIESEDDAKQVCQQVRDDLDRLLARFMTYPDTNVIVSIVNRFYLENLFKAPGEGQACVSVYGATTSNRLPGDRIVHSVCVLSHLPKARLMAVCAHEYTHAWMGQNVSRERTAALDKDTLEAFCELVAYKYMESRQETLEMQSITRNQYTHGKIDVLIAADANFGFNSVVDWIKAGDDTKLELPTLERVRAVNGAYVRAAPAPTTAALLSFPVSRPTPEPTTLVLKGISGTGNNRFALINNTTFETMEKAKVRLGQTNVMVRCLEIHNDSVTIQMDGSAEKKQLFLKSQ
jgi:hypothetical protein